MFPSSRTLGALPIFLAGWLLAVGPASAAEPEIKDDAGFFSKEALQKAGEQLREIQKEHGKDVRIETFPELPADKKASYDPKKRDSFFSAWAGERAKAAKVNGVYVLCCKDPGRIQIAVDPETEKKAFAAADHQRLRDLLVNKFKEKKYDDGLLDGIQFIRETLKKNLPAPETPGAAHIRDHGKFFSAEAVRQAETTIQDIEKKHQVTVLVETYDELPPEAKLSEEGWRAKRSNAVPPNAIGILIYRYQKDKPHGHIDPTVGKDIPPTAFTAQNRGRLFAVIGPQLDQNKNDQGLLDAVRFIGKTLDENTGRTAAAPVAPRNDAGEDPIQFNWLSLLCPLLVCVGVIWLVIGLIRAATGAGGGGIGGGGFMTGLLGGLFGAMAGNWLYHSFFGGPHSGGWSSSAYGSDNDDSSSQPSGDSSDSSGGDYSGGDFGGSGGDFGGGDFGGSGGDF